MHSQPWHCVHVLIGQSQVQSMEGSLWTGLVLVYHMDDQMNQDMGNVDGQAWAFDQIPNAIPEQVLQCGTEH